MEGKGGGVFRGGNKTGGNKDGEGKGKRSLGMANTKMCQGYSKIFSTGKIIIAGS